MSNPPRSPRHLCPQGKTILHDLVGKYPDDRLLLWPDNQPRSWSLESGLIATVNIFTQGRIELDAHIDGTISLG